MAMFGITTHLANEKYLIFLCSQGSLPAFFYLKHLYSKEVNAIQKILELQKYIKKKHPYLHKELDADPIKSSNYSTFYKRKNLDEYQAFYDKYLKIFE